jgi:Zn-dependent alcohol dehydrogenase
MPRAVRDAAVRARRGCSRSWAGRRTTARRSRSTSANGEGKFPFDRLITMFPFGQVNEALEASASGEVIKPVLVFD